MSMKVSNSYARSFDYKLYERIPKAVFAAVAFSFCSSGGDDMEHGVLRFIEEWIILNENGIVLQTPPPEYVEAALKAQQERGERGLRAMLNLYTEKHGRNGTL